MFASESGQTGIVELLISRGADIHAKNKDPGFTPLMFASLHGHTGTVEGLISRGADINSRTHNGVTALMTASLHAGIVAVLISRGADINAKSNLGKTALMFASLQGHAGTVQLLISRGADIHATDNDGKTALVIAQEKGKTAVVSLLQGHSQPVAPLGVGGMDSKRSVATAEAEVERLEEEMHKLRVTKKKAEAQLEAERSKTSQHNQSDEGKVGGKSGPAPRFMPSELQGDGKVVNTGGERKVTSHVWRGTVVAKATVAEGNSARHHQLRTKFLQEVQLVSCLRHPQVMSILAFCDEGELSYLMPLHKHGDLSVGLSLDKVSNTHKWRVASQVALALRYLHAQNVIHFDLKSANILLCDDFEEKGSIKLIDFGMAQTHSTCSKINKTKALGGTLMWKAPERLNTKISKLSPKIDVWAFGVLLVELFADTPIWDDMDDTMISEELKAGRPPEELEELLSVAPKHSAGKHLHALARACFLKQPEKRPDMEMVVKALEELAMEGTKPSDFEG